MSRKYNKEIVEKKLSSLGLSGEKRERAFLDVTEVAELKVVAHILDRLPEELRDTLKSMPTEDIQQYFKENRGSMPMLTEKEIHALEDETWDEYFEVMEKK